MVAITAISRMIVARLRTPNKTYPHRRGLKSPAQYLKALWAGGQSALADFHDLSRGIYPPAEMANRVLLAALSERTTKLRVESGNLGAGVFEKEIYIQNKGI
jgi:hypothetical protein